MKCEMCEQERMLLDKEGVCIVCRRAQEKAMKEEGNWKKQTYIGENSKGVEVKATR